MKNNETEPKRSDAATRSAPTDNGIPELDELCDNYNKGKIDLCALVCQAWNKGLGAGHNALAHLPNGGRTLNLTNHQNYKQK